MKNLNKNGKITYFRDILVNIDVDICVEDRDQEKHKLVYKLLIR